MKVLLINGSRRKSGCTYTALCEVAGALQKEGIETEILYVGLDAVNGNIDQAVKEAGELVKEADGIVVGSPVYYASPSGEVLSFLDRLFWLFGDDMKHKPGAAVVSARRAGTTASLDVLNKYFMINEMPVVSSQYWNMVHGNSPEEVKKDEEGMQIMRTLGRNMAWLIRCIAAGKEQGIATGPAEERAHTNFIR